MESAAVEHLVRRGHRGEEHHGVDDASSWRGDLLGVDGGVGREGCGESAEDRGIPCADRHRVDPVPAIAHQDAVDDVADRSHADRDRHPERRGPPRLVDRGHGEHADDEKIDRDQAQAAVLVGPCRAGERFELLVEDHRPDDEDQARTHEEAVGDAAQQTRARHVAERKPRANARTPTETPTRYIWSAHVPEPSGPPMTPACMKPTAAATRHDPASVRNAQIRLRSRMAPDPARHGEPDHQDQPDRDRDVIRRRVVGQRGRDRRDDGDDAADERRAAIRPRSSHPQCGGWAADRKRSIRRPYVRSSAQA